MDAHQNSGELREWTAHLRQLREQVQAIAGGTATTTPPVLGVADTDGHGIPVIRPAMLRSYTDTGPASA